jgi:hypothetical protein
VVYGNGPCWVKQLWFWSQFYDDFYFINKYKLFVQLFYPGAGEELKRDAEVVQGTGSTV